MTNIEKEDLIELRYKGMTATLSPKLLTKLDNIGINALKEIFNVLLQEIEENQKIKLTNKSE